MARSEVAASFAFISIDSIIPQGEYLTLLSLPCAEIWRILLAEAASNQGGIRHGSHRHRCPHPTRPSHPPCRSTRTNRCLVSDCARRSHLRQAHSRTTQNHFLFGTRRG